MQGSVKEIMTSAMREGKREAFAVSLREIVYSIARKQADMWVRIGANEELPIMDDSLHLTNIYEDLSELIGLLDKEELPEPFVVSGLAETMEWPISRARKINEHRYSVDPEIEKYKNALLDTMKSIRDHGKHAKKQWIGKDVLLVRGETKASRKGSKEKQCKEA
jgi:hypothetical protein